MLPPCNHLPRGRSLCRSGGAGVRNECRAPRGFGARALVQRAELSGYRRCSRGVLDPGGSAPTRGVRRRSRCVGSSWSVPPALEFWPAAAAKRSAFARAILASARGSNRRQARGPMAAPDVRDGMAAASSPTSDAPEQQNRGVSSGQPQWRRARRCRYQAGARTPDLLNARPGRLPGGPRARACVEQTLSGSQRAIAPRGPDKLRGSSSTG
jgi:hypothetical protein